MNPPVPLRDAFQREVRHFVIGSLLFVLSLAIASLVGLWATTGWALRQHRGMITAETLAVGSRLVESRLAGAALLNDARTVDLLRQFGVLQGAVYDPAGRLSVSAAYLPWANAVPMELPPEEVPPTNAPVVVRREVFGSPAIATTARLGSGGSIVRLVFDGKAVSRARWAGFALTGGVAVTGLLLGWLTIPFLRKLLRPIDALTETARSVSDLVPSAGAGAGEEGERPDGDEPGQAVATFARTIEELRRRSEEVGVLRLRELAALGEMSAGIAHEFRNATATILGYVRLAAGDVGELARKRHLDAIRMEAEHVARITGDFLFFARPGSAELQTTDLSALVREVVNEEAEHDPGTRFSTEGEFGEATVDPQLVRRALVNLLRNAEAAASASGREGKVVVRGEPTEALSSIAVEDDGPGVPPEEVPRLFVPFHSTKESGTGLGLALVARIAALHGGTARVEKSERLGGARFVVTFSTRPV